MLFVTGLLSTAHDTSLQSSYDLQVCLRSGGFNHSVISAMCQQASVNPRHLVGLRGNIPGCGSVKLLRIADRDC
jgi:hypothetical protein